MDAVADLLRDDDTPPPSGIRVRVPERAGSAANDLARDVLPEVAEEVFREVWELVHALSPLQGAWLRLGIRPLGSAVLTALRWRAGSSPRLPGPDGSALPSLAVLRARWPELVPGYAAMNCLAGLMVDALCG
jgi:hypothetical protein